MAKEKLQAPSSPGKEGRPWGSCARLVASVREGGVHFDVCVRGRGRAGCIVSSGENRQRGLRRLYVFHGFLPVALWTEIREGRRRGSTERRPFASVLEKHCDVGEESDTRPGKVA